jgi:(5-formylfuran-3-yl)methyl phosphate synthase
MTGLLVSVRSAEEARLALAAGVDLIDVKEPTRGALGAASPEVWREVQAAVAGCVPTSVALGELAEQRVAPDWASLAGWTYAKLGLAGCGDEREWSRRWADQIRRWPPDVTPVAVVYADWQAAHAPTPDAVMACARRSSCGAVLVDTHDKRTGNLLTFLDLARLANLVAAIRQQGLRVVLGGALDPSSIPPIVRLQPDYVAVRGAACESSRTSRLDPRRLRELVALVKSPSAPPAENSCRPAACIA